MTLLALTRHDIPILSKTFTTRQEAITWASDEGQRYGASRIVQTTKRGPRTIWRYPVTAREGVAG